MCNCLNLSFLSFLSGFIVLETQLTFFRLMAEARQCDHNSKALIYLTLVSESTTGGEEGV